MAESKAGILKQALVSENHNGLAYETKFSPENLTIRFHFMHIFIDLIIFIDEKYVSDCFKFLTLNKRSKGPVSHT